MHPAILYVLAVRVNLEEEYARLYGSTAGLFSGEAV